MNQTLHGQKILLSGLPPGDSGTGRFLKTLIPIAQSAGYIVIHPTRGDRFLDAEYPALAAITNSHIVILHPQTLGLGLVLELFAAKNQLSMYVLDNSFFCMQSYNYRPGKFAECLDCLRNADNCHPSCNPFPVRYQKSDNLAFLKMLKTIAPHVQFFCQTEGQKRLLIAHFGDSTRAKVLGMRTEEFADTATSPLSEIAYDVVFHADALLAKGLQYALALAMTLPELRFLFPFQKEDLDRNFSDIPVGDNCSFKPMRWETGLRAHLEKCRVVLCPSLWSAPVEGALMKSLFYNGNVAAVSSQYGFTQEIPEHLLLRLDGDLRRSANVIRNFLLKKVSNLTAAREWVREYNQKVKLEEVFT